MTDLAYILIYALGVLAIVIVMSMMVADSRKRNEYTSIEPVDIVMWAVTWPVWGFMFVCIAVPLGGMVLLFYGIGKAIDRFLIRPLTRR